MNRRKFLLTSGAAALLGSTSIAVSKQPVIGLDFELSADISTDISAVDSILVDFSSFELLPQYVDENAGKAIITITLEVENQDTVQYSTKQKLINGQKVTKDDIGSMIPLVVDGIDTTSTISGEVRIDIEHPSVSDSYKQSFFISDDLVLDELIGWWPLNENDTNTASDISGNGNNGSINGATQGVWGRGGLTAYSFDGSDSVRLTSELYSGHTVCYWFYHRSNSTQQVTGNSDRGWHWIRHNPSNNNLELLGSGGTVQKISVQLPRYEWTHLTIDYTGLSTTVYKNGDFVTDYTGPGSDEGVSIKDIGTGGDSYFDGIVCDFRVYNRELSDNEIKSIYRWGSGDYTKQSLHDGTDSGAVGRWDLNNSVNDVWGDNDGIANSADYSSNSISGTSFFLDGSDNYIDLNSSLYPSGEKTLSIWFRYETGGLDGGNDAYLFDQEGVNGNIQSLYYNDDTELVFKNNSTGTVRYSTNISPETWNLVTYTYDGNSKEKLFLNGSLVSEENNGYDTDNANDTGLGTKRLGGGLWEGQIDDARIYDRALSNNEVFQLYQWGARGKNLKEAIENYQSS